MKAVVFDFGNVLTMDQEEGCVLGMCRLTGLSLDEFRPAYRAPRLEYDRGTLDAEAYWREVLTQAGRPADELLAPDGELVGALTTLDIESWTVVRRPMVEWARSLKASGFKTAILSNMPGDHAAFIERSCEWLEHFDVRLFSYAVRLAKPGREIYAECLRRLSVDAAETLFIDDLAENVAAARAAGIRAIQFRGEEELKASLAELPALPPLSL